MKEEQYLDLYENHVKIKTSSNIKPLKYIFIEDEQAIIVKFNNKLIKIPDVNYVNKESAYNNIDFTNCIYVEKNYIDAAVDNILRYINYSYNLYK